MGERLKRGGPHPDGVESAGARLLKGRPTWNQWKNVVEDRLGISFKNSHRPAESLAHEFYRMRRLHQIAGQINQEEVREFWQRAEEQIPDFEDQYGEIIYFISDKVPV